MTFSSGDIDVAKLRQLIRDTAAEIRPLKTLLRTTWTEPMGEIQRHLCALKTRATLLCIVAATRRGRFHLQRPVEDRARHHTELAAIAVDRFDLRAPPAAVTEEAER